MTDPDTTPEAEQQNQRAERTVKIVFGVLGLAVAALAVFAVIAWLTRDPDRTLVEVEPAVISPIAYVAFAALLVLGCMTADRVQRWMENEAARGPVRDVCAGIVAAISFIASVAAMPGSDSPRTVILIVTAALTVVIAAVEFGPRLLGLDRIAELGGDPSDDYESNSDNPPAAS